MGMINSMRTTFRSGLRSLFIFLNNVYVIPTYSIWCVLLLPLRLLWPELYWWIEGQFFEFILNTVASWSYSNQYYVIESGDRIDHLMNEETLILANHQSTGDVPFMMQAFSSRRGLQNRMNWVIDAMFEFTPFGVVSFFHGDFFIKEGREFREATLIALNRYLREVFLARKRKWLVLFPEGGFLCNRKEASKRYAERLNLPSLSYVTVPRLGAFKSIMNMLAPVHIDESGPSSSSSNGSGEASQLGRLKYIIDMTIAYPTGPDNPLNLINVAIGNAPACNVRLHYNVYSIAEVPYDDHDQMVDWINSLYIDKNNLLGHYYKTGIWNPNLATLSLLSASKSTVSGRSLKASSPAKRGKSDDEKGLRSPPAFIDLLNRPPKNNGGEDDSSSCEGDLCIYQPMSDSDIAGLTAKDRMIQLDWFRLIMIHAICISSTLLHLNICRMICKMWP